jgi:hypothetical protein
MVKEMVKESEVIPHLTEEVVKAKINLALSSQQYFIQKLQSEADALVFNEDNLAKISEFIDKVGKIDNEIASNHKKIKEPYWNGGKVCDAAKNSMILSTSVVVSPVRAKYVKMCNEIAERKRKQEEEERREKEILKGIETNVIEFSARIAACETNEELLSVERLINLQKTSSSAAKYGKHHQMAIDKFDEILLPILKLQKEKVKESERIANELKIAESVDDIDKIDALKEAQVSIKEDIQYNKVKVQEEALNQEAPVFVPSSSYTQVMPFVKAKRTTWEIEIVDKKAALKGAAELLDISLNKEAAKIVLKTLKDSGILEGKTEYIKNGIRYYENKTY